MPGKRKSNKKYKKLGKGPEDFENSQYGYPQAPKNLKFNNEVNENPLQFWQRQKDIRENNEKIKNYVEKMQNERNNINRKIELIETKRPKTQQKSFLNNIIDAGKTAYKYATKIKPATKLLNAFPSLGEKKYVGTILKSAKALGFGKKKGKLTLGNKHFKNQKSKMAYIRSFKK